ncbi:2-dehydropantoate 2-reductase [Penicillium cosmopolitanum]|uniref:2-dehydropantoate 2-reductase n=1 Tax=Penicillium cosmopolitanum TaxID=1131564 RepID=A0A9X0B2I2_9EURO|nr:2-dehydropantoate 2-reductase [Penicillium cosmopolitanum]KAJ5385743.1 2-dehydropantoate 2-reductase [Penicillium cosmopolitanum]
MDHGNTLNSTPNQRKRNICLIGSGGVGTIASLVLEKSGRAEVTAVLRSKFAVIRERGWDIESVDHGCLKGWRPTRVVSNIVDAVVPNEPFDFIVITTKQLPEAYSVAELVKPAVSPGHTSIVLIQNGLDIEVPIIAAFPNNTVISGISMIGSRVNGENCIIHDGPDDLVIGTHFHDGKDRTVQHQQTREFVNIYAAGTVGPGAISGKCTFTDNMLVARWQKLLWNSTFNTLCTLLRMDVGELQSSGGRETLLIPAMWEVYAIAKAVGHAPAKEMIHHYAYRSSNDCRYRPSMLLDLENNRPMELEVLLGNPLRKAKQNGVSTPILSTVYELLKVEKWRIDHEKGTNILDTQKFS